MKKDDVNLSSLSRRDALKLSALLAAAPAWAQAQETLQEAESNGTKPLASNAKIVIAGGGDAGITIAARLARLLENPDITIIEPNAVHYYQPGQTLVASGVWELEEITFDTKEYIPEGMTWIEQKVARFEPERNTVVLDNDQEVLYDYLVVATGLELRFDLIAGLGYDDVLSQNIHSIYDPKTAEHTFAGLKALAHKAKTQKVTALFTHPNTHIKCGGAPKKIMFLAEHYLRNEGVRDNVTIRFLPPGSSYFGIEPYETSVKKLFEEKQIEFFPKHHLVAVDKERSVATFDAVFETQGAWDAELEEFDVVVEHKSVEMAYDFIHIAPPMHAHGVVKASPLAWQKGANAAMGLLEVDSYTLQHARFPNVFGAGDVIGAQYGKTGGSVRKQAPVVARNIVRLIEGQAVLPEYHGYTVCPLITGYGTVLLAEFDYEGVAPSFPLDPSQERWLWWLLKVYALKPMYFHGMLRGRA